MVCGFATREQDRTTEFWKDGLIHQLWLMYCSRHADDEHAAAVPARGIATRCAGGSWRGSRGATCGCASSARRPGRRRTWCRTTLGGCGRRGWYPLGEARPMGAMRITGSTFRAARICCRRRAEHCTRHCDRGVTPVRARDRARARRACCSSARETARGRRWQRRCCASVRRLRWKCSAPAAIRRRAPGGRPGDGGARAGHRGPANEALR